jgi:hypothetical protein
MSQRSITEIEQAWAAQGSSQSTRPEEAGVNHKFKDKRFKEDLWHCWLRGPQHSSQCKKKMASMILTKCTEAHKARASRHLYSSGTNIFNRVQTLSEDKKECQYCKPLPEKRSRQWSVTLWMNSMIQDERCLNLWTAMPPFRYACLFDTLAIAYVRLQLETPATNSDHHSRWTETPWPLINDVSLTSMCSSLRAPFTHAQLTRSPYLVEQRHKIIPRIRWVQVFYTRFTDWTPKLNFFVSIERALIC